MKTLVAHGTVTLGTALMVAPVLVTLARRSWSRFCLHYPRPYLIPEPAPLVPAPIAGAIGGGGGAESPGDGADGPEGGAPGFIGPGPSPISFGLVC
jgi:hypothetical protein